MRIHAQLLLLFACISVNLENHDNTFSAKVIDHSDTPLKTVSGNLATGIPYDSCNVFLNETGNPTKDIRKEA